MTDPHLRNPNGRLWLLFDHLDKNGDSNQTVVNELALYLGVETTPNTDFYSALSPVLALPAVFREAVMKLVPPAIPQDDLLDEMPKILATVSTIGTLSALATVRGQHDAGTMKTLAHASHILNNAMKHAPMDVAEPLAEMRALADELIAILTDVDSTIDPELRLILLDHMSAFVRSVDLYKVTGLENVVGEIDRLKRDIIRQTAVFSTSAQSPALWGKFSKFLTFSVLVGAAFHVPVAIADDVTALLQLTMSPNASSQSVEEMQPEPGPEVPVSAP